MYISSPFVRETGRYSRMHPLADLIFAACNFRGTVGSWFTNISIFGVINNEISKAHVHQAFSMSSQVLWA
jgi:hypothetical protein